MRRKKEKISLVLFLLFLKVSWIKVKNNHNAYLSESRNQTTMERARTYTYFSERQETGMDTSHYPQ